MSNSELPPQPTIGPATDPHGNNEPNYTIWTVFAVLDLLTCSLATSIVAFIFLSQARTNTASGHHEAARKSLKGAKITLLISLIFRILTLVAVLVIAITMAIIHKDDAKHIKPYERPHYAPSQSPRDTSFQVPRQYASDVPITPFDQTASTESFDFKAKSFKCSTDSVGTTVTAIPSYQRKFCLLTLTATYKGAEEQRISAGTQQLEAESGPAIFGTATATRLVNQTDPNNHSDPLYFASGQSRDITLVFNPLLEQTPITAILKATTTERPVRIGLPAQAPDQK